MTDKQEQALATATTEEQQNAAAPGDAPQPEQEKVDPAVQLRNAMASNYMAHCVNSRAATASDEAPVVAGTGDAVHSLLTVALMANGKDGVVAQFDAIFSAMMVITINDQPLPYVLAERLIAASAQNGNAIQLAAQLQASAMAATVNAMHQSIMGEVRAAKADDNNPMKPFPENAEAVPAVDHEQHIEEAVAEAIAKDEAGEANYTSAEEARQVMDNRKRIARQEARNANKRRPRNR